MLKCRLKLNKNNKNVKDGASVPKTWYFKFSSKMVTKFIIGCDANILQPLGWNKRTFMIFIWWMIFSWFSTNKRCWVLRSEGIILVYKMKQYKYFKNVVCASVECVWNYNSMLGKKRHVVIECVGQCPSPFAFDFCKLTSHNTMYPFQICTILRIPFI
jgi:hypothetical protein